MNTTTSAAGEWLIHASARSMLSQQLRTVGRSLLDEIRARHFPPLFACLLTQALRAPGKLLSSQVMRQGLIDERDLRLWPLLALLTAVSAAGMPPATLSRLSSSFWRRARAAAVAAEFLGVALDGIDDVQDGDSPFVLQVGTPIALNGSIAFLALVPLALDQARKGGWPDTTAVAAHELLFSSLLTSLEGQFLDLHFERLTKVTEPAVIDMTEKKAGTLLGLVCQLGAMSALSTPQQRSTAYYEEINRFGWYLGVWSQVLNDLYDAEITQGRQEKSDRQREKKTLPLFVERQGMPGQAIKPAGQRLPNARAAFAYSCVVAESYRLRAQHTLRDLEEHAGPHPLLWPLIEQYGGAGTDLTSQKGIGASKTAEPPHKITRS